MQTRQLILFTALLLTMYAAIICPFTAYMVSKPSVEKLGIIPRAEFLQAVSADQKQFVGASIIMKVIMYFGSLAEQEPTRISIPPDYPAMSRILHAALKLDPYNMDGYYFTQAILVWDVKQYQLANNLLEYGMKYRTWDWYLPFFAGFNAAYFLKDPAKAATYYMKAGELSGNELFSSLAGRYLQQSGQTDQAILYLSAMIKSARNPAVKKSFATRLAAFKAVQRIESAVSAYRQGTGVLPANMDELVQRGYLSALPVDPYGGRFYLEADGRVATTSKFAAAGVSNKKPKREEPR